MDGWQLSLSLCRSHSYSLRVRRAEAGAKLTQDYRNDERRQTDSRDASRRVRGIYSLHLSHFTLPPRSWGTRSGGCRSSSSLLLTFPLEKRHDGLHALDVSSAHCRRPVDSRLPSFKRICSGHSRGGKRRFCSPPSALSNRQFTQIQTQPGRHIVNKRPTSGLVRQKNYGKICITCFAHQRSLFAEKKMNQVKFLSL